MKTNRTILDDLLIIMIFIIAITILTNLPIPKETKSVVSKNTTITQPKYKTINVIIDKVNLKHNECLISENLNYKIGDSISTIKYYKVKGFIKKEINNAIVINRNNSNINKSQIINTNEKRVY